MLPDSKIVTEYKVIQIPGGLTSATIEDVLYQVNDFIQNHKIYKGVRFIFDNTHQIDLFEGLILCISLYHIKKETLCVPNISFYTPLKRLSTIDKTQLTLDNQPSYRSLRKDEIPGYSKQKDSIWNKFFHKMNVFHVLNQSPLNVKMISYKEGKQEFEYSPEFITKIYEPKKARKERLDFIKITSIRSLEEHQFLVNDKLFNIFNLGRRDSEWDKRSNLLDCIQEAMKNIPEHAYSSQVDLADRIGYMAINAGRLSSGPHKRLEPFYKKNEKQQFLEIVIVDTGKGNQEALKSKMTSRRIVEIAQKIKFDLKTNDDEIASLIAAFEPGITSKEADAVTIETYNKYSESIGKDHKPNGYGLTNIREYVAHWKGLIEARSGKSRVTYDLTNGHQNIYIPCSTESDLTGLPGTQIRLLIPRKNFEERPAVKDIFELTVPAFNS